MYNRDRELHIEILEFVQGSRTKETEIHCSYEKVDNNQDKRRNPRYVTIGRQTSTIKSEEIEKFVRNRRDVTHRTRILRGRS